MCLEISVTIMRLISVVVVVVFTLTVLSSRTVNMGVCSGAQHRWVNDFEYLYVSQRDQWC